MRMSVGKGERDGRMVERGEGGQRYGKARGVSGSIEWGREGRKLGGSLWRLRARKDGNGDATTSSGSLSHYARSVGEAARGRTGPSAHIRQLQQQFNLGPFRNAIESSRTGVACEHRDKQNCAHLGVLESASSYFQIHYVWSLAAVKQILKPNMLYPIHCLQHNEKTSAVSYTIVAVLAPYAHMSKCLVGMARPLCA
jgi:hypothetical protein